MIVFIKDVKTVFPFFTAIFSSDNQDAELMVNIFFLLCL